MELKDYQKHCINEVKNRKNFSSGMEMLPKRIITFKAGKKAESILILFCRRLAHRQQTTAQRCM
jgi:hypothetical protein